MRHRCRFGIVLLGVAACAPGGPTFTDADAAVIRQLGQDHARLTVAGALDSVLARRTADAVWMPPDAPAIQGTEALRQFMTANPPAVAFTITSEQVVGSGDIAFDRGHFVYTVAMGADTLRDHGKYLVILRRQADGTWLAAVEMWSSNAPPEE